MRLTVSQIMKDYRPGSRDWSWDDEFAEIDRRILSRPVLLGTDGRVWDGHHRIRLAAAIGEDVVLLVRLSGKVEIGPRGE